MNRPSKLFFVLRRTHQNQDRPESPAHLNGPSPRTGVLHASANPSLHPRRSSRSGGSRTLQHRCEAKGVTTGLSAAMPRPRLSEQEWLKPVKGSFTERETFMLHRASFV